MILTDNTKPALCSNYSGCVDEAVFYQTSDKKALWSTQCQTKFPYLLSMSLYDKESETIWHTEHVFDWDATNELYVYLTLSGFEDYTIRQYRSNLHGFLMNILPIGFHKYMNEIHCVI